MSLNKFTELEQKKQWMNINANTILADNLEVKTGNNQIVSFKTPDLGAPNYVLTTDGAGNCSFVNLGGSGGDPLLFSRTQNIDDTKTIAGTTQINGITDLFTLNVDTDFNLKMGNGSYVSFKTPDRGMLGYILSTDGLGSCSWISSNSNDVSNLNTKTQNIDLSGTSSLITQINGMIKCPKISSFSQGCNIGLATDTITNTASTINLNASTVQQNNKKVITEAGNKNLDTTLTTSQIFFTNGQELVTKRYVDENSGGSGGIKNPIQYTLIPATNDIDLGTSIAPFRKLYVQNQTIELVNSIDPTKSGSLSIQDGNINLSSNLLDSNVNLGNDAGLNAGINCTNIGNKTGENSGDNCINLGFQAGYQNCLDNAINIGNGAGISSSGENSISIGTLAGAGLIGGYNGTNSICIGESAGQTNASDNSIIINATGFTLNSPNEGLFVKPIRDLATYSKVLAYDDITGEIFSSTGASSGKTQNIDEAKTDNTRTYFNHIVESDTGFKITGGTNIQYLMADGTTTTSSGNNENSNIYLYNNNTNILPPPGIGQIRYNNSSQQLATELYISHRTRDTLDIDAFLALITTLNIIYIQDQENSLNYIKYNVDAPIIIIPNDYITVPVSYLIAEGNGLTSFGNGHNIFMSIFTNTSELDTRLSALETKTQDQTAISGTTTFNSTVVANNYDTSGKINGKFFKDNGVSRNMIIVDDECNCSGTQNFVVGTNNMVNSVGIQNISFGTTTLTNNNNGNRNIALGSATLEQNLDGSDNIQIGVGGNGSNQYGNGNVGVGSGTNYTISDYNTSIGHQSGPLSTLLTQSTSIGYNSRADSSYQVMLGDANTMEVKSSGIFTSNIGFKTSTGTALEVLLADGSVNTSILDKLLNLNATNTFINYFCYFSSLATLTANSTGFFPSTALNIIGGTTTAVSQVNTNSFTKIWKVNNPTTSVANGQRSGYIAGITFPKIWVGSGFVWNMSFGIGDTNTSTNSICQMFCGFSISTTAPSFSSSLGPNTNPSILGIGCDIGDSILSFYNKGVSTTNPKIATTFSASTPSTIWFNITFVNLSNSNDIQIILTGIQAGVSTTITQTFTLNTGTTILNTSLLYPIYLRGMGTPSITGSAQTYFQKFSLYL